MEGVHWGESGAEGKQGAGVSVPYSSGAPIPRRETARSGCAWIPARLRGDCHAAGPIWVDHEGLLEAHSKHISSKQRAESEEHLSSPWASRQSQRPATHPPNRLRT